jgi:hypothetical protein
MNKHLYLISLLMTAALQMNAQILNGQPVTSSLIMNINGKPWEEIKYNEVEGFPFLTEDWNVGFVKFVNEGYAKDMLLRLDLYTSKLYFKRNDSEFTFMWPVHQFRIRYKKGLDSSTFRSKYPSIDKNNDETFYEVLVDGKFQLLNYYSKVIQEYTPYNEPPKKRFATNTVLYAQLPDGSMIKIKNDKDAILASMPQYADAARKIIDNNKLKLKTDDQVVRFFTLLNQQQ